MIIALQPCCIRSTSDLDTHRDLSLEAADGHLRVKRRGSRGMIYSLGTGNKAACLLATPNLSPLLPHSSYREATLKYYRNFT